MEGYFCATQDWNYIEEEEDSFVISIFSIALAFMIVIWKK